MATSLCGQQLPAPLPNRGQPPPSSQENPPAPSPNRNPPTRPSQPGAPTSPPSAPPTNVTLAPVPLANSQVTPLAFDEAVRLALAQPSKVQQNQLNELIAAEDVRQARLAFLPRFVGSLTPTFNSPLLGPTATFNSPLLGSTAAIAPGRFGSLTPTFNSPLLGSAATNALGRFRGRSASELAGYSFVSANAITEYGALAGATGNLDLAGRLRATLRRNVALLEAARARTEASRRELILAVNEAYYGLSLAAARRQSAELNLTAAEESERAAQLKIVAGKAAQVDVLRARVNKAARRDELEQARAAEAVAGDSLRILIGYDFTTPISTTDLITTVPDIPELSRFTAERISCRPELAQLDAQLRAAQQDVRVARAGRLPQLSYSINGGVDADSLGLSDLHDHTGVLATVSLTIPLFDWGSNRGLERQTRLRALSLESQRALALRSLTQEFYAALTQALSAATRAKILQTGIADAERNVQMSIARYRAGETQMDEVTEAQTALAATRLALYQALFDYQISRGHLAQAACQ